MPEEFANRLPGRKAKRCEHHWRFWGQIKVANQTAEAYVCTKCPILELHMPFGSPVERDALLEGRRLPAAIGERSDDA